MSIPLDRLYHYIESIANELYAGDTIIYRFYPHGSKNISDLTPNRYHSYSSVLNSLEVICHDQEPLDFNLYKNEIRGLPEDLSQQLNIDINLFKTNIRESLNNVYDKALLIHSEKNSAEVDIYQKTGFIPVFYWSHALIALDWYRYAKFVNNKDNAITRKFLIYNRAWSGTREYRLKFLELLVNYNLLDHCQVSCSFVDPAIKTHYSQHFFKNENFKPTYQLEQYFSENKASSCSSADFDINDYNSCDIEVVLETLFDDQRIHLTEKILRPIALNKPFILCSSANSLQYLKEYGFKTFDSVIDESYDTIKDPVSRLDAIVKLLHNLKNLNPLEYNNVIFNMKKIADFNKKHFFSLDFFNQITQELTQNLQNGFQESLSTNSFQKFLKLRSFLSEHKLYSKWRKSNVCINSQQELENTIDRLQKIKQ